MPDLLPDIILPEDNIEVEIQDEFKDFDNETQDEPPVVQQVSEPSLEGQDIEEKMKELEEDIFVDEKPKKKKAAPRPRKMALSNKQAEHLAKARQKGLEVRRKKAAAKKLEKEEEDVIKEQLKEKKEKELLKKKYKVDQPIKRVYELDDEMIRKLKLDAIESYDSKRKARKAKKREEQTKTQNEKKTFETISKAVNASDPDDLYNQCFGLS